MIIVIQCAAKKKPDAGHLRQRDGRPVLFVADPATAPTSQLHVYARPDDISDTGVPWRDRLSNYNDKPGNNPLGLLPAWQLYTNKTYGLLANKYGPRSLFILSAGWGLIAADYLTPAYDITFSPRANNKNIYKRRRKNDLYKDICMLPADTIEPIVFFGGKDYVPLFCTLTDCAKGQKFVFYNSKSAPNAPGCSIKKFCTSTKTNWHYECTNAFMKGDIGI